MDISIRHATAGDFDQLVELDGVSFGAEYTPEDREDQRALVDLERFIVAVDDDVLVGVTGDYQFAMTVPGGASLEVPGVTWVSVSPTHRRRGILAELMRRQLSEYYEAGAPLAILTASESGIYGRFGYGAATRIRKVEIDRRRATLRRVADADTVVVASPERARAAMPAIHERWRAQTPGAISRRDAWWDMVVADRASARHGLTKRFYLLHPDGYVAYRVREDWNDWHPRSGCIIVDYVVTTAEARAALWQVLLGLDLFGSIESDRIPVDDPLPFLLTEPRLVRTTMLSDGVWVRPLDVAAMLAARRYAVDVDVVLDIADGLFGDGRYRLRGGPDGATCERTDRVPDVRCDVSTLGALYLGGQRLHAMRAAGLLDADDATARRFEAALLADREPFHGTPF